MAYASGTRLQQQIAEFKFMYYITMHVNFVIEHLILSQAHLIVGRGYVKKYSISCSAGLVSQVGTGKMHLLMSVAHYRVAYAEPAEDSDSALCN